MTERNKEVIPVSVPQTIGLKPENDLFGKRHPKARDARIAVVTGTIINVSRKRGIAPDMYPYLNAGIRFHK